MTKAEKKKIYDSVRFVLKEFESEGALDGVLPIPNYTAMDLYYMLLEIENRWLELTGEEM